MSDARRIPARPLHRGEDREPREFVAIATPTPEPAPPIVQVVQLEPGWTDVVRMRAVALRAPAVPAGTGVYALECRERASDPWRAATTLDGGPLLVPSGATCHLGVWDDDDPGREVRFRLVAWHCPPEDAGRLTPLQLAPLLSSDDVELRLEALAALAHVRDAGA